eukprot:scpid88284/ scgid14736/ 
MQDELPSWWVPGCSGVCRCVCIIDIRNLSASAHLEVDSNTITMDLYRIALFLLSTQQGEAQVYTESTTYQLFCCIQAIICIYVATRARGTGPCIVDLQCWRLKSDPLSAVRSHRK